MPEDFIENELEKSFIRVLKNTSKELAEQYIRNAYKLGIKMINKYHKIAESYGMNVEDFIDKSVDFYTKYFPIVSYLYDRLEKLELIYSAIYTTIYKIFLLLSDFVIYALQEFVNMYRDGKISKEELIQLTNEIMKVYHDAYDRLTTKSLSEIVGNESETRVSDTGYSGEEIKRHRKTSGKRHSVSNHDDATTTK